MLLQQIIKQFKVLQHAKLVLGERRGEERGEGEERGDNRGEKRGEERGERREERRKFTLACLIRNEH